MPLISDADLASLRQYAQQTMTLTATILRDANAGQVSPGGGAKKPSYTPHGTTICRIASSGRPSEQQTLSALAVSGVVAYVMIVPPGTDLARNDQVRVTAGATVRTLLVIGVDFDQSDVVSLHAIVKDFA